MDESSIQQFAQKKWKVNRPVGTQFNDCYTQAIVKHPFHFMIWGAMSNNDTAGLFTNQNSSEQHKVQQNVGGQA